MNNVIDDDDFGEYFNQTLAIVGTTLSLFFDIVVMIFPFVQVTHFVLNHYYFAALSRKSISMDSLFVALHLRMYN